MCILQAQHHPARIHGFANPGEPDLSSYGGSIYFSSDESEEQAETGALHFTLSPAAIEALMVSLLTLQGIIPVVSEQGMAYSVTTAGANTTIDEIAAVRQAVLEAVRIALVDSGLFGQNVTFVIEETPEVLVDISQPPGHLAAV